MEQTNPFSGTRGKVLMTAYPQPTAHIIKTLQEGQVIPAHPLALTPSGELDTPHQRALTRYYLESGAGGIAVGVHTTQFEIRDPQHGLLKPVLQLAEETVTAHESQQPDQPIIRIAGICGNTNQAVEEAMLARDLGYHIGLLSLGALREADTDTLIKHANAVAHEIPIMGFYLQPAVGGRYLDYAFWRRFCEIPNVVAIKIAPFNRYQTLDVLRGAAASGRAEDIALYTGNDDTILFDLFSRFAIPHNGDEYLMHFVGGLLGHWAFWTKPAVEMLNKIKTLREKEDPIPQDLTTLAWQITDVNSAVFDPANRFAGCISGIHEILHRQGLMRSTLCLNKDESLSPGQKEEIDRVYQAYPHLNDDAFIQQNLERWLQD
ncbi:dihydrodipicolinate synthase family protein [bacterium]|nr:dihydrodipicolinate synthase family protein [bacterium]